MGRPWDHSSSTWAPFQTDVAPNRDRYGKWWKGHFWAISTCFLSHHFVKRIDCAVLRIDSTLLYLYCFPHLLCRMDFFSVFVRTVCSLFLLQSRPAGFQIFQTLFLGFLNCCNALKCPRKGPDRSRNDKNRPYRLIDVKKCVIYSFLLSIIPAGWVTSPHVYSFNGRIQGI